jgi:putative ABC transport system permease protein
VVGVGAGALLVETSAGLMPGVPPASATLTPTALLAGFGVGITMELLAAHGSARRALAMPPVAAMPSITAPPRRPSRLRALAGPLLLVAGVGSAGSGAQAGSSALLAAGAVMLIVGFGAVFPLATGPVLAVLSRPLDHAGVAGGLARQQALAAPRRTGATAAALAVALALVSFLMVVSATLGTALADLVTTRQHAEFMIRPSARQGLHDFLFDAADRIEPLPGVATAQVVTYGEMRVIDPDSDESRPRTITAFVTDPTAAPELFDITASAGDLAGMDDGITVRDTVAAANDWRVGRLGFPLRRSPAPRRPQGSLPRSPR